LLAYTYTFAGAFSGFSATVSVEDGVSRCRCRKFRPLGVKVRIGR